jgi:hypothetical protein
MRRVNKREWDAAMFPIDTLVDLGHPNDAKDQRATSAYPDMSDAA